MKKNTNNKDLEKQIISLTEDRDAYKKSFEAVLKNGIRQCADNAKLEIEIRDLKKSATNLVEENKRLEGVIEEQNKVLDGKDESIDRLGKRMYVLIRERDDAKQQCEELINRLKHLCESKVIAAFDEVDPRTKEYKLDISLLDKTMADYAAGKLKEAFEYVYEGSKLAEKSIKDLGAQLKAYTDKLPITCNYNIAINTTTEKEEKKDGFKTTVTISKELADELKKAEKKDECPSFEECIEKLQSNCCYGVVDDCECSVTPLPRPCLVNDVNYAPKKPLCDFHKWVEVDDVVITFKHGVQPSLREWILNEYKRTNSIVSHRDSVLKSCKVKATYGLVEYPDGSMHYVKPEDIQFCNEDGEVPDDIK